MNNVRFSTALHILTLHYYMKDEMLTSEFVAGSMNVNAAIVRKETSNLRKFGLITSKEGKGGGTTLAKPAKDIRLSDVYNAVRQTSPLGKKNVPNPDCPVGKQINVELDVLYNKAEEAMVSRLAAVTLEAFCKPIK
ncbi:Rrf2 family transcriptional regulator [Mucilaginibacter sp. JRF]|uniref:Rrf2 family transcriptional regulator n=1 Tax=Mucilaginibacter sp. JRF TaxID=2780088 RepID=UPI0018811848|nr:Rrf2 family transcriptional regulator [Mucilaginibacter sp. JRF]MBE9585513.1 Rrf2 family transcriptional regulator [Mucilaginibacter sp. JRF]